MVHQDAALGTQATFATQGQKNLNLSNILRSWKADGAKREKVRKVLCGVKPEQVKI